MPTLVVCVWQRRGLVQLYLLMELNPSQINAHGAEKVQATVELVIEVFLTSKPYRKATKSAARAYYNNLQMLLEAFQE